MAIEISSFLIPRNSQKFFLLEDVYLKGGFRIVASVAERDALHASTKKSRMVVVTADTGTIWQLQPDLRTWAEFRSKSDYFPFFVHDQFDAASTWTIEHAKDNQYLTYSVFTYDGEQIYPDEAAQQDTNTLVLKFNVPVSGYATVSFAEMS